MAMDTSGAGESAIERWDELHQVLASQERRMVIYSLMDAPQERRLPLPEAAMPPESTWDPERMSTCLRHNHLPQLAEAGYIR